MKIVDILHRSSRNLKSAKARTILTALAIAVGAFTLTLTLSASNGIENFVGKVINDNFDPAELVIVKDETALGRGDPYKPVEYDESLGSDPTSSARLIKQLTADDIAELRGLPEVEQVREGILLNLLYLKGVSEKKYAGSVIAFSPAQKPELVAGQLLETSRPKTVLIPEAYVSVLGFSSAEDAVGKPITYAIRPSISADEIASISTSGASLSELQALAGDRVVLKEFTISGILKKTTIAQPGTELYMYISVNDARELYDIQQKGTDQYQKYPYAYVRIKGGTDKATLKQAQDKINSLGYVSQSVEETQEFLNQIISILRGVVVAFAMIALIASIFGVINTMYISVLQRTREIGLMKALGMRRKDVGRLFRYEAAWIGFLGGFIGCGLAIALGSALNPTVSNKIGLGEGQNLMIFDWKQIGVIIISLIFVAIFAGWLPSRKAAKLDPINALKTE